LGASLTLTPGVFSVINPYALMHEKVGIEFNYFLASYNVKRNISNIYM